MCRPPLRLRSRGEFLCFFFFFFLKRLMGGWLGQRSAADGRKQAVTCWGRLKTGEAKGKTGKEREREEKKEKKEKSSRKNRGVRLSGPGMISAYFRIFSFYYSTLIVAVLSLSLFVDWSRCRKPFISSYEAQSLLALFFIFILVFFGFNGRSIPDALFFLVTYRIRATLLLLYDSTCFGPWTLLTAHSPCLTQA